MDKNFERMWAPWRMNYIDGSHKEEGCFFCSKPNDNRDRENLILYRGKNCFTLMNLFPYNNGHIMISPYKHTGDFENLNDEEMLEIMKLSKLTISAMKASINPAGFNAGFNLGRPAGAGVADHLHFHIVPRWNGDTNFMPVIGETKVISEHILQTYDKIKDAIKTLEEK